MYKIICERCKKHVMKPHSNTRFCSRSCARTGQFGPLNNGWKGGIFIHQTTNRTFIKTAEGYKFIYRQLMEEILGRKLLRNEVVHHKDEDPTNNDPDNLEVMTRSEHIRLHNYLSPRRNHKRDSSGRFTHKNREDVVS